MIVLHPSVVPVGALGITATPLCPDLFIARFLVKSYSLKFRFFTLISVLTINSDLSYPNICVLKLNFIVMV